MTTTLPVILWLVFNSIGVIAALWLSWISYQRKLGVEHEKHSILPKQPRLRSADRQIRDRASRALFQLGALLIGALVMFHVTLPPDTIAWLFVFLAAILSAVSVIDLYGEMND